MTDPPSAAEAVAPSPSAAPAPAPSPTGPSGQAAPTAPTSSAPSPSGPSPAPSPSGQAAPTAPTSSAPSPSGQASPTGPGGPLAGITVLDLASVGPAARCTRLLADYGATVVKVGAVPGTGAQPITPPFYAYSGSRYLLRTAIDLKAEEGRQAFLALVRTADVVIESFRPGVVDRLGIGFEDLCAVNPRIILCSTTGYGQDGPRSAWAGHDINYLAQGGYLAATEPAADGGPPVSGSTIADAAGGGMHAAMAVMAALVGRAAGGPGVHLDVSIADGVLWLTSLAVDEYLATGADVGHGHNIITGRYACYDTYQAADGGWLAVGAIEPKFYANLCRLIGCEQWADHQLDDGVQDKIRSDFKAAFAAKDRDTWVAELAGADTCVTPVLSVAELVEDEQFLARRVFVDAVTGPPGGGEGGPPGGGGSGPTRFRQVGPLLAGMRSPDQPVVAGDPLRTDTDRLLAAAGLAPSHIGGLRERGIVA
ncbi:MAG: CaiB/BaiF CoA-transferase family protein [Acidimicrobiales bacterium]